MYYTWHSLLLKGSCENDSLIKKSKPKSKRSTQQPLYILLVLLTLFGKATISCPMDKGFAEHSKPYIHGTCPEICFNYENANIEYHAFHLQLRNHAFPRINHANKYFQLFWKTIQKYVSRTLKMTSWYNNSTSFTLS